MDNERDAIERDLLEKKLVSLISDLPLDLKDPDDRQWFIECTTLRAAELNAEADLWAAKTAHLKAETAKIEAETNLLVLKASQPTNVHQHATLEVTCGYCEAEFKYSGHNEAEMATMHDRFVDEHGYCRS